MTTKKGERPLKICHTCRYWSYRFKGFCEHLHQGVGRFWVCQDWAAADEAEHLPPKADRAGAGAPSGS